MFHILQLFLILFIACVGTKEIDPYKILNIPSTASQKRIKSAYKEFAKKYHPDKNKGDSTNAEKFAQISAAYELLKNPKRKKDYDNKRRRQRNPFQNMWQQARSEDGGLGAQLTRYNYDTLVKKSGKTWFIVVYSNWNCRSCKKAKELFEEVCDQMRGLVKCGKINRDLDYQWVSNGLQIRRIPVLIARRGKRIEYLTYQMGRTQPQHVKNAIDKIYSKKEIEMIKNEVELKRFLTLDIHSTRALIFSAKTQVPHVFMRHAAAEFPKVRFGFVHSQNKNTMQTLRTLMQIESEGSVLVIVNSVLPFSEHAEHSEIDLAIYKRDVPGLLSAIKERAEADLPLLSFSNFVDMCYSTDGKLDPSVRCFLYLFDNSIPDSVKQLITRLQSAEGVLRTAAVDCTLQKEFCEKMGYEKDPAFIGVSAHSDKYVVYPYGNDLLQFGSWASRVQNSFEDLASNTGVPFPAEQVDSFTRARRKLNKATAPLRMGAGKLGSLGSSAFSTLYSGISWVFNIAIGFLVPLLFISMLFMQRRI